MRTGWVPVLVCFVEKVACAVAVVVEPTNGYCEAAGFDKTTDGREEDFVGFL